MSRLDAEGAVRRLARGLPPDKLLATLVEIRKCVISTRHGLAAFVRAGGLTELTRLLRGLHSAQILNVALSTIGNCTSVSAGRQHFVRHGGLHAVTSVLQVVDDAEVANRACRTLANLAREESLCRVLHLEDTLQMTSALMDQSQPPPSDELKITVFRLWRNMADTGTHQRRLLDSECLVTVAGTLHSQNDQLVREVICTLNHFAAGFARETGAQVQGAPEALASLLRLCGASAELPAPAAHAELGAAALQLALALTRESSLRAELGRLGLVRLLGDAALRRAGRTPGLSTADAAVSGDAPPAADTERPQPASGAPSSEGPESAPEAGDVDAVTGGVDWVCLISALCLFSWDSVNRARLRSLGYLPWLLALMDDEREPAALRRRLLHALVQFVYDEAGMNQLRDAGLLAALVRRLRTIVDGWAAAADGPGAYRADSPTYLQVEAQMADYLRQVRRSGSPTQPLCKTFSPSGSVASSPHVSPDVSPPSWRLSVSPGRTSPAGWSDCGRLSPAAWSDHPFSPAGSPTSPRLSPGSSWVSPSVSPGSSLFSPPVSPGSSLFSPPVFPGSSRFSPPVSPGSSRFSPPVSPGSSRFSPPVSPGPSGASPPVSPSSGRFSPVLPGQERQVVPQSSPPVSPERPPTPSSPVLPSTARPRDASDGGASPRPRTASASARRGDDEESWLLLLLSRESQREQPSRQLVSSDCCTALLDYLRLCARPQQRAGRILSRLCRNPYCFAALVSQRLASQCVRRLSEADAVGPLDSLRAVAESGYGRGVLESMLEVGGASADAAVATAAIVVRLQTNLRRLLVGRRGLDLLLDRLTGGGESARPAADALLSLVQHLATPLREPSPPAAVAPACAVLADPGPCDVTLVLEDGEVTARRGRLAAAGPVLAALLTGGFRESSLARVPVGRLERAVAAPLVHLAYGCGRGCRLLDRLPARLWLDLLAAADRFLLTPAAEALGARVLAARAPAQLAPLYLAARRRQLELGDGDRLHAELLRRLLATGPRSGARRLLAILAHDEQALLADLRVVVTQILEPTCR